MLSLTARQRLLAVFAQANCQPCRTEGDASLCANERRTKYCLYVRLTGQSDIMDGRYYFRHGKGKRDNPSHYQFYRYPLHQRIYEFFLRKKSAGYWSRRNEIADSSSS